MSIFGSPGFCIIKLMLKSMNGLLKSMSNSRSAVIVIGASAMSFVCKGRRHNFYHIIRSPELKQKYDFGQRFQTVFCSEFSIFQCEIRALKADKQNATEM